MRKVWVLDTGTKGTGASVVPLESTRSTPEPARKAPLKATKAPARKRDKEPKPRPPRRLKIVDLVSSETLAEGADMQTAVAVLADVRSPVDVRIFVWDHEGEKWRLLTLGEQRALWDAGHRRASTTDERASSLDDEA
jgi:hypothetical protein